MDIRDIIDGCRNGSRLHQQALYELFSKKMYRISLSYVNDPDDAMDILHDAFMKVFKGFREYETLPQLDAWLRRVTVNTAIDYLRRKKRLQYIGDLEGSVLELESDPLNERQLGKDLKKIIDMLPAGAKTVYNLYCLEGYNHREISGALGISEGTSKSQLSRARELLRQLILEHYEIRIPK